MSSTGAARTKSRDSMAWVSYAAALTASHVQGRHHRRAVKETVMPPTITSEVVVAYAQCPRKAYLLLCSAAQGDPHEYVRILERQRREHQVRYLDRLKHKHADIQPYTVEHLRNGREVLMNAWLQTDGFSAM